MTLRYPADGILTETRGDWPTPSVLASFGTLKAAPLNGRAGHPGTEAEKPGRPPARRRRRSVAPLGIDLAESRTGDDMRALAETRLRVRRGRRLYRAGDPFEFLYLVRCGFFKSTVVSSDGREQITGFNMIGDLLGFDGIGTGLHTSELAALEDSEVYAIPYAWVIDGAGLDPVRRRIVHNAMSREIVRENNVLVMLGSMCAEERIAGFLLGMAERLRARGYSPAEFILRMTRSEIGSFLGLKLETVSRQLSHMAQHGLIEVNLKHVRVVDADGLRALVTGNLHGHRAPMAAAPTRAMPLAPPVPAPLAAVPGAFV